MAKRKNLKLPVIPVPKTLEEATKFLGKIGEEQRSVDIIKNKLNADVDALKTKAMENAEKHQTKITQLMEGLYAFAEANRDELTDNNKKKSVETPKGMFGWRITPPKVILRNQEIIIETLKSLALDRFVRIKEQINKEALLKESNIANSIKGVSINQREEFVIKPAELEIEITSQTAKLKKSLAKRNS